MFETYLLVRATNSKLLCRKILEISKTFWFDLKILENLNQAEVKMPSEIKPPLHTQSLTIAIVFELI